MSKIEYPKTENLEAATIYHGDALVDSEDISSGCLDLIVMDLPYGTIKGISSGGWDSVNTAWDIVIDTTTIMNICNRLLRNNGKMVLFAQQPFTTELINKAIPNLPFSYNMIWSKGHFANALGSKKAPVNYYEDMPLFQKRHPKHDFEGSHPLRPYFGEVFKFIGKSKKEIIGRLGARVDHTMRFNSSQFTLGTPETYAALGEVYHIESMPGFRSFGDLQEVDLAYRAGLLAKMSTDQPSVFNLPEGTKHKSNIFTYNKDFDGYHPTQKPIALLCDLIETFSNPGDTVGDLTMGSGSTGVASRKTGRGFYGIEKEANFFNISDNRIREARPLEVSPELNLIETIYNYDTTRGVQP